MIHKYILFFHHSADLYGSDKSLLNTIRGLEKDKIPIVLLAEEGILCKELANHKIEYHVVDLIKLFSNSFTIIFIMKLPYLIYRSIKGINKIVNNRNISLVYTNSLATFIGGIWARINKIHHIWHVREIITTKRITQITSSIFLLLFSNKIICNSKATRNTVVQHIKYLKRKTHIIHNGIEPIKIKKKSPGKKKTISLIGRINNWKGQKLFISAINQLVSDIPEQMNNIQFLIVGSPYRTQSHLFEEIRSQITNYSLDKYITLIPYTKDIESIYTISDIITIPSINPEPFGLVAIEGMSCGKAIIAANHGGLKEIVKHGETGYLFNPTQINDLTKYLKKLILNEEICERLGAQGRVRFKQLFSLNNYSKKINKILSQTI